MPEQITIPRSWLTKLVEMVDKLADEDEEARVEAWKVGILGYVHSLDEYLKDEK